MAGVCIRIATIALLAQSQFLAALGPWPGGWAPVTSGSWSGCWEMFLVLGFYGLCVAAIIGPFQKMFEPGEQSGWSCLGCPMIIIGMLAAAGWVAEVNHGQNFGDFLWFGIPPAAAVGLLSLGIMKLIERAAVRRRKKRLG
jgi:hypothetical protein